jgi:hypothetical protein
MKSCFGLLFLLSFRRIHDKIKMHMLIDAAAESDSDAAANPSSMTRRRKWEAH